ALFVPLALAVGFSMVTSYILSSTFVPVLSVWLLRHYHPSPPTPLPQGARGENGPPLPSGERGRGEGASPGRVSFDRLRERYAGFLRRVMPWRWALLAGYLGMAAALVGWWLVGHPGTGTEIFPSVDAGQFQLRLRAPTGTRIQRTEELTLQALEAIKDEVGP